MILAVLVLLVTISPVWAAETDGAKTSAVLRPDGTALVETVSKFSSQPGSFCKELPVAGDVLEDTISIILEPSGLLKTDWYGVERDQETGKKKLKVCYTAKQSAAAVMEVSYSSSGVKWENVYTIDVGTNSIQGRIRVVNGTELKFDAVRIKDNREGSATPVELMPSSSIWLATSTPELKTEADFIMVIGPISEVTSPYGWREETVNYGVRVTNISRTPISPARFSFFENGRAIGVGETNRILYPGESAYFVIGNVDLIKASSRMLEASEIRSKSGERHIAFNMEIKVRGTEETAKRVMHIIIDMGSEDWKLITDGNTKWQEGTKRDRAEIVIYPSPTEIVIGARGTVTATK